MSKALKLFFDPRVLSPLEELHAFSGVLCDIDPQYLYNRSTGPSSDALSKHVRRGFLARIFRQFVDRGQGEALAAFLNALFGVLKESAHVDLSGVNEVLMEVITDSVGRIDLLDGTKHCPIDAVLLAMRDIKYEHVLAFKLLLNVIPDGGFLLHHMVNVVSMFLGTVQRLDKQDKDRFVSLAVLVFRGKLFPHMMCLDSAGLDAVRHSALDVFGETFKNWHGSAELALFFADLILGEGIRFVDVVKSMEKSTAAATLRKQFVGVVLKNRAFRMIRHLLFGPGGSIAGRKQGPVVTEMAAVYLMALGRTTKHGEFAGGLICHDGNCMMCRACMEQTRIRCTDLLVGAVCTSRVCVHNLVARMAGPWGKYAASILKRRMTFFGEPNTTCHIVSGCPCSDGRDSLIPCRRPLVFGITAGTPAGKLVLGMTRGQEPLRPYSSPQVAYNAFYKDGDGSGRLLFFKIAEVPCGPFIYAKFQQLLRKKPNGSFEPIAPILVAVALNGGGLVHALNCIVRSEGADGRRMSHLPDVGVLARFVCAALIKEGSADLLCRFADLARTGDRALSLSVQSRILQTHLRVPSNSAVHVLTPEVCQEAFRMLKESLATFIEYFKAKTLITQFVQGPLATAVGTNPRMWGFSHVHGYCTYNKSISKLFPRENREAFAVLMVMQRLASFDVPTTPDEGQARVDLASLPAEVMKMCILNYL